MFSNILVHVCKTTQSFNTIFMIRGGLTNEIKGKYITNPYLHQFVPYHEW
jgi:hypothetical protein